MFEQRIFLLMYILKGNKIALMVLQKENKSAELICSSITIDIKYGYNIIHYIIFSMI